MLILADGYVCLTLFDRASRFIGVQEFSGALDHPLIMAWLKLTGADTWTGWPEHDEVPWCSAALNSWAWDLRLPRSKSLTARSWLGVGRPIGIGEATPKNDAVILKGGGGNQPGPEVLDAPGHVGVFARREGKRIWLLGGNQGNQVSIAPFPEDRLLGVRRLL